MDYHRAALKELAKARIRRARPRPRRVMLVFLLLSLALSLAAQLLAALSILFSDSPVPGWDAGFYWSFDSPAVALPAAVLVCLVLSWLLMLLVSAALTSGGCRYSLHLWREENASYGDLLFGFPLFGRSLALLLLILFFSLLWALLALGIVGGLMTLVVHFFMDGPYGYTIYSVASVLLVVALYVFLFSRTLRYALAFFVLVDRPELTARQALRESKALMAGRRWDLFVLLLSFYGWLLLAFLILEAVFLGGVAFLTLLPLEFLTLASSSLFIALLVLIGCLVSLPLTLWLMAYLGASLAGFYDCAAGRPLYPVYPQEPPYDPEETCRPQAPDTLSIPAEPLPVSPVPAAPPPPLLQVPAEDPWENDDEDDWLSQRRP